MIKFFRNIRHRLLRENRFTRYLIYAMGEILLVVIGILIALNINNWNTDRQLQRDIKNFKVALYKDFQLDSINIIEKIADIQLDIEQDSLLRIRFNDPAATMDTLVKIARYEFNISSDPLFNFNENTIESFRSTGHFQDLKPNLRNALLTIQNSKNEYEKVLLSNVEFFYAAVDAYRSKYPARIDPQNNGSPVNNLLWQNAGTDLYALVNATMNSERHLNITALNNLIQIQIENNQVLSLLQQKEDL